MYEKRKDRTHRPAEPDTSLEGGIYEFLFSFAGRLARQEVGQVIERDG